MDSDGIEPCTADDAAQYSGDDDGVVGITEDWHEVGDEIDGESEVGQQQSKPDAHSTREGLVSCQPADQTKDVGQQPQRLTQQSPARANQDQSHDQSKPCQH